MKCLWLIRVLFLAIPITSLGQTVGAQHSAAPSTFAELISRFVQSDFGMAQASAVLTSRCVVATNTLSTNIYARRRLCRRASREIFKTLDPRIDFKCQGLLFFSTEFSKFISAPLITSYLSHLLNSLNQTKLGLRPSWNLWEQTLHFSNQNKELAIRLIAVLFQDSEKMLHIRYARCSQLNKLEGENLDLLEKVQAQIGELSRHPPFERTQSFSIFPQEMQGQWPAIFAKPYHFYIPALLANAVLRSLPSIDSIEQKNYALAATMSLSLNYQFAKHYGFAGLFFGFEPIRTAHQIDNQQLHFKYPDWLEHQRYESLFMNYLGVGFATDLQTPLNFHEFRNRVALEPNLQFLFAAKAEQVVAPVVLLRGLVVVVLAPAESQDQQLRMEQE